MKITSINLNGIRSAVSKDFKQWVSQHQPDFIAVQETKAQIAGLDPDIYNFPGYFCDFHVQKKRLQRGGNLCKNTT